MHKIYTPVRRVIHRLTKPRDGSGFSMLEAVVVVGVLLALAVSGFFAYGPITKNAKIAKARSTASDVYTAVRVAQADGDPTTTATVVINNYNSSDNKIKVEIRQGAQPAVGAMFTAGYEPVSDNDFCVKASMVEDASIFAEMGNCTVSSTPAPTPTATATPTPTPTAPSTTVAFTPQTAAPGPVFTTSSDLSTQIASVNTGSGYSQFSANSGASWTPITGSTLNNAGGMSPNGKYILIGGNISNGYTKQSYISKDSGSTWSPSSGLGTSYVESIAISNDGMKIMVVGGGGGGNSEIKVSSDGGATFAHAKYVSSSDLWTGIAGTDDLSTAYAVDKTSGTLYTSTNGGTTWTSKYIPGISRVAVSSTGKTVVLGFVNATVQISNDYGVTFNAVAVGITTGVHNVDPRGISNDGQSIVVSDASSVYLSRDTGATWTKQTLPSATYVARISGDGTKFLATTSTGVKYSG